MKAIKEKFVSYLSAVEVINGVYTADLVYEMLEGDSDFAIIKEKMDLFIVKVNSLTEKEMEEFIQLDVETEVWDLLK